MRLWYPPNDKPVFIYRGISVRDYEWSQKSPLQKKCLGGFSIICVIVWGYVVLAISTGHLMTLADLNWKVVWGILSCILIMALFPAIILPVLFAVKAKYPREFQHTFYRDWARLLKGYGKGAGPICFFVEDVDGVRLQRSVFEDKPIFLLTIQFKPLLFLRRGSARIICAGWKASNDKGMSCHWPKMHRWGRVLSKLAMVVELG